MRRNRRETDVETTPSDAEAADMDLIASALAGDDAAYGRLYDRYAALIRAVCHDSTRDLHEAQDLCQEVFLRAYSGLGELRDSERFAAWLVGISRMVCREWCRKSARAALFGTGSRRKSSRSRRQERLSNRTQRVLESSPRSPGYPSASGWPFTFFISRSILSRTHRKP